MTCDTTPMDRDEGVVVTVGRVTVVVREELLVVIVMNVEGVAVFKAVFVDSGVDAAVGSFSDVP